MLIIQIANEIRTARRDGQHAAKNDDSIATRFEFKTENAINCWS